MYKEIKIYALGIFVLDIRLDAIQYEAVFEIDGVFFVTSFQLVWYLCILLIWCIGTSRMRQSVGCQFPNSKVRPKPTTRHASLTFLVLCPSSTLSIKYILPLSSHVIILVSTWRDSTQRWIPPRLENRKVGRQRLRFPQLPLEYTPANGVTMVCHTNHSTLDIPSYMESQNSIVDWITNQTYHGLYARFCTGVAMNYKSSIEWQIIHWFTNHTWNYKQQIKSGGWTCS